MIWIDYALSALLALSAFLGALRGYKLQFFFLVCGLAALLVGLGFSRDLAYFLPSSIKDPNARLAVAFVCLYVMTTLLGRVIQIVLGNILNGAALGWPDRIGGLALGLLQGGLWLTAIVILAGLSVLPASPWWPKATLLPPFQTIALWFQKHVPSDLLDTIHYR